jgi:acetate---CoA ligase (ADP-forming)
MSAARLARLLRPRHVAFVGGRSVEPAIRNCVELGFAGDIWVVNPRYDELGGYLCHGSVADLPDAPDAAFVGVGREATVEVVRELAARGAGGCVCLAAGFAEVGAAGRTLQEELVRAAGDMPVVGPNCYGILNYADRVALWPDLHGGAPVSSGAALVAQSGNLTLNATMADRSVPFTHVLSIGNQAVTGFATYVDALLEDPRVRAIGLYVEAIPDLVAFRAAAVRALDQGVPLVALRSGASPVGAQVVGGHTGALVPPDAHYDELLGELGVAQVPSLTALLESLKLFGVWQDGSGPRLAAVAASGGDIAVLADLAEGSAVGFPPLADERVAALREQLGGLATVGNPLDHNTGVWGRYDELVACFSTVMEDDLDAVLLVSDHPRPGTGDASAWDVTIDAFVAAHERTGRRAAVVSCLPEGLPEPVRARLLAAGIPPLQGMADAVTALDGAVRYRRRHTSASPREADRAEA